MHVTRLRVYPVKSFAGVDVGSASVLPWGLAADRRWAVVDPNGDLVTARESNRLLTLTAEALADGGLLLGERDHDDGGEPLRVDVPTDAAPIPVTQSRQGTALPAGVEADEWLSARLGRPVRLVWQPDPRVRPVSPARGGIPGEWMSLADAAPLLLVSEASLAQLDRWTPDTTPPLDVVRFRPNVVIDGEAPFAEDDWPFVTIGDLRFRVSGGCDRCVMTTIDPVTLAHGKEPIRTLAKHRRWDGKTWFGALLMPASPGRIAVGDTVQAG